MTQRQMSTSKNGSMLKKSENAAQSLNVITLGRQNLANLPAFCSASNFDLLPWVMSLCSFRDADAAKHALDVYGRIIGVQQLVQVRIAAVKKLFKVLLSCL